MRQQIETVSIEQVPIGNLRPDPFNPRKISEAELEALTRSLRAFGFVQPVVARREDNTVIGGHQRLVAARKLGYTEVPVVFLDIPLEQARVLNLALNKISGTWDEELLARLLKDLSGVPEIDLSLSGFEDDELKKLLKRLEQRDRSDRPETFDLKVAIEEASRKDPVTQAGDRWLLGDHRLLCGDSTDPEALTSLMDGQQASLLATDPPYLVDYTGGDHPATRANKGHQSKDKHWDEYVDPETSVDFYVRFLKAALPHLRDNTAIYQWHAHRRQALVDRAWQECGLLLHQILIWVKPRAVLNRSHYMWAHEPCAYGWVEGKPPQQKPPGNVSTIWTIAGEHDGVHPTQKPLEVFTRPISYHTQPDEICLEPFAGSGTCLIAAEKLGRRCYAIEQSPRYCDVIIARWEHFSGEKTQKTS